MQRRATGDKRPIVDFAIAATGLVSLLATLRVWPFELSRIFAGADVLVRLALSIAAFALAIAVVVNALRLIALAFEPPRVVVAPSEPRDVLVTYASKHGATEDIARRIAKVLRDAGLTVDLLPAGQAPPPGSYGAVVLGSAVYYGMWRSEAGRWLRTYEGALSTRPVWLFSSGPTGKDLPADIAAWRFPSNLKAVADRIHPRETVVFGGALDPKVLGRFERFVVGRVGAEMGDFRDWDAIDRWATSIAQALRPPLAAAG